MVKVILFDLGNTLISYYSRNEFPGILEAAIKNCAEYLNVEMMDVWKRVQRHNHGSPSDKVYPMQDRLSDIFRTRDEDTITRLCDIFMEPIFGTSRLHDDVNPVLKELKRRGMKVGIISNTPWGCPARLWELELNRYGLLEYLDDYVFCVDVGWRKPDERVFLHALERLGVEAKDCIFVGDDPRWDIVGPEKLGMKAMLIDRTGSNLDAIHGLDELIDELDTPSICRHPR